MERTLLTVTPWKYGHCLGTTDSPAPRSAPWYRVGINTHLLNGKNVPLPWDHLPLGGLPPQSSSCLPGGYRTQNAHCVPLETAIQTVSSHAWAGSLTLACLSWLTSVPAPTPSPLQVPPVAMQLLSLSLGHKSTWSTWWELARQPASKQSAFLNKE